MEYLSQEQTAAVLKRLIRTTIRNQIVLDALQIALAGSRFVPFPQMHEAEVNAKARYEPLICLLDESSPDDFLQAFEKAFPK